MDISSATDNNNKYSNNDKSNLNKYVNKLNNINDKLRKAYKYNDKIDIIMIKLICCIRVIYVSIILLN